MLTAEQYIAARVPEYSGSARVPQLLPLAELNLFQPAFGEKYGMACGLLVLHWLTCEALAGGLPVGAITGAITGEKEGELSRNYGSAASSVGGIKNLESTLFGLELESMIKAVPHCSVANGL